MRAFNLTEAIAGKKVVTRNGKSARIICSDRIDNDYPLVVLVMDPNGEEDLHTYCLNGSYYDDHESSENDLFMETQEEVVYVNVLRCKRSGSVSTMTYTTEESAKQGAINGLDLLVVAQPIRFKY